MHVQLVLLEEMMKMEQLKFTPTERTIYEVMLKAVRAQEKPTVATIAQSAGVVPSSVIKVAKKLGYPGWSEMYYTLSSTYTDEISLSFDNFDFLSDRDTDAYIETLCEMLIRYHDDCILVSSVGDGEFAGEYLIHKLWMRGFIAMPYYKRLLEVEDAQSKTGVVFVINESGIVLLNSCVEAKEKDYNIVSITSNRNSPLASNSHVTIELKNHKSSLQEYAPNFFTARVIVFIELLFVTYDELMKERKRK